MLDSFKLTRRSDKNTKFLLKHYRKLISNFGMSKSNNFVKFLYEKLTQSDKKAQNIQYEFVRQHISSNPFEHINSSRFLHQSIIDKAIQEIEFKYICKLTYANIDFHITFYSRDIIDINKYIYITRIILALCLDHITNNEKQIFHIDIILSSSKKSLPSSHGDVIEPKHINSGFTMISEEKKYTLVFRSEEWIKVLIHEFFHLFCFDSHEHIARITRIFKDMYGIESNFLLFESIVEFWSRVINCGIVTFLLDRKMSLNEFSLIYNVNLNLEKIWSIHQSNRLLSHFGYTYESLINKNIDKSKYIETTNTFNYTIVTAVLLINFDTVIQWFMINNNNVLRFEKDENSIILFLAMYKKFYKNKDLREIFQNVKKIKNSGYSLSLFEIDL